MPSHAPILPRIHSVSPMISGSEASFAGRESPTCNCPARTGWTVDIGSGEPYVEAVRTCVIVFSPVCLVLFFSS